MPVVPEDEMTTGAETREPTNCTSAPVVPVMSTARIDPPAARHVPTFTWTGAAEPPGELTEPVESNAGALADVMLWDPVLMTALRLSEVSGGTEEGAVTPVNPVTPAHVPIGRVDPPPSADDGGVEGGAAGPIDVEGGAAGVVVVVEVVVVEVVVVVEPEPPVPEPVVVLGGVDAGLLGGPSAVTTVPLTAADAATATHDGVAGAEETLEAAGDVEVGAAGAADGDVVAVA